MEAKVRKLKEAVGHLCTSFYWRLFAIKEKGGKRVEGDIGGVVVTENTQGIHRLSIPTQDRLDLW